MSAPPAQADDQATIRRTILLLSVCGFASAMSSRFVDPMVGAIARDLLADPLRVALLSTAFALPYALIQPLLGPVGDALGKERILKFLLVGLAASLAGAAFVGDLTLLFVFRVLSGLTAGAVIPLSLATIGDRVVMAERQVAIGRFLTATISGQLLGGVGAGLLADIVGWRGVFVCAGGLAAVAAASVAFGFHRANVVRGRFSLAVAASTYRRIVGIGRARALMFFVFAEGVLLFGIPPYLAPLLEEAHLGGPREAGLIVGGFALGGVAYSLLVRALLRILGLRRMLIGGGLVCAVALGGLAPLMPWPWQAAAMFVLGVGFYMMHNSFQTQMTEVVPEARGSAVALHAFGFFVGQALGPVMFGQLLGPLGRVGAMAVCAVGLLALGLAAARVLTGPRPQG